MSTIQQPKASLPAGAQQTGEVTATPQESLSEVLRSLRCRPGQRSVGGRSQEPARAVRAERPGREAGELARQNPRTFRRADCLYGVCSEYVFMSDRT